MAYSRKSIAWARRKKPVACSCGCEVIIMPRPAWYAKRNEPPEVRFIRGHTRTVDLANCNRRAEMKDRPSGLILSGTPSLDDVTVKCPRLNCGTRWQISASMADLITEEGCSFCAIDDIVADRMSQGIPVWPADDLDETEGAIEMDVPTYLWLKEMGPTLHTNVPSSAQALGDLARHIKDGTFRGNTHTANEIRDILDQCGLSEEYLH